MIPKRKEGRRQERKEGGLTGNPDFSIGFEPNCINFASFNKTEVSHTLQYYSTLNRTRSEKRLNTNTHTGTAFAIYTRQKTQGISHDQDKIKQKKITNQLTKFHWTYRAREKIKTPPPLEAAWVFSSRHPARSYLDIHRRQALFLL